MSRNNYPNGQVAMWRVSFLQNSSENTLVASGDSIPGDPFAPMPVINNPPPGDNYPISESLPAIPNVGVLGKKNRNWTDGKDYQSSQTLGQTSYSSSANRYSGFVIQTRTAVDSTPANGFVRNAGWGTAAAVGTYNLTNGVGSWMAK